MQANPEGGGGGGKVGEKIHFQQLVFGDMENIMILGTHGDALIYLP
jgi:hypothetical protein